MEGLLIALVVLNLALQVDTVRRVARIDTQCQARKESYGRRFLALWRAVGVKAD